MQRQHPPPPYLIQHRLQCDVKIISSHHLHHIIDTACSQGIPTEDGVCLSARGKTQGENVSVRCICLTHESVTSEYSSVPGFDAHIICSVRYTLAEHFIRNTYTLTHSCWQQCNV